MNLDHKIREALRSSTRPADPTAGYQAVQARLHDAPHRQTRGLRIALYASLAVVIVAAITVGSLEAVKHLGSGQPILVITDDTTGVSSGSTGQVAQSAESVPSAAIFRGNAARTGVYPSGGPIDEPQLLWKFKTGGGEGSSPVVSDGVVYVGGGYAYLYSLDAQSGEERWKSPWSTYWGLTSCPVVCEGLVYIGSYDDGHLSALDSASGEERWRFQTGDCIESSPAVSDGVVYFGSHDGYLYALDAASGELRWKFLPIRDGESPPMVNSSPAVSEGVVYFSDSEGYLFALDAQTGQQIWGFGPANVSGSFCSSSPAVSGGVVYFAYAGTEPNPYVPNHSDYYGYVYALDAQTGQERWMYKADGGIRSSPAVSDGVIYFLQDVLSGMGVLAVAVDAATGKELWQFPAANDSGWGMEVRSSPSISGEVVYFGAAADWEGRLYALDVATGEELWAWVTDRSSGGYTASSSPAISDGVMYFSGNDGYLYALK